MKKMSSGEGEGYTWSCRQSFNPVWKSAQALIFFSLFYFLFFFFISTVGAAQSEYSTLEITPISFKCSCSCSWFTFSKTEKGTFLYDLNTGFMLSFNSNLTSVFVHSPSLSENIYIFVFFFIRNAFFCFFIFFHLPTHLFYCKTNSRVVPTNQIAQSSL